MVIVGLFCISRGGGEPWHQANYNARAPDWPARCTVTSLLDASFFGLAATSRVVMNFDGGRLWAVRLITSAATVVGSQYLTIASA